MIYIFLMGISFLIKLKEDDGMKTKLITTTMIILFLGGMLIAPVLASEKKSEKIEYALSGEIWDNYQGIGGTISLTFSGQIAGAPDYEYEDSGVVEEPPQLEEEYFERYFQNETGYWKWEISVVSTIQWTYCYSIYEAWWYSPQPEYYGELVAIWQDDSTAKFRVVLSPLSVDLGGGVFNPAIRKYALEETRTCVVTQNYRRLTYWRAHEYDEWKFVGEDTYPASFTFTYTQAVSTFDITFSGRIVSEGVGRQPQKGELNFWDSKVSYDDNEYRIISGQGTFGPYSINICMWL